MSVCVCFRAFVRVHLLTNQPTQNKYPTISPQIITAAVVRFALVLWSKQYHKQDDNYEKSMRYINMGFTGMFSVETVLKIIGFGIKVGIQINTLFKFFVLGRFFECFSP